MPRASLRWAKKAGGCRISFCKQRRACRSWGRTATASSITCSRAALWPDEHGGTARDSGVAIVTQSGNIAVNFTMTRRGLPVAGVFALGNQADVDIAKMLEVLAEDDRITAVGLHIEGLKDLARFTEAAIKARRTRKPVIALKTGRSEQGAEVTMSHTNSLAGADALYDALFARYGIARVHSITAFVETLKLLHHGGPLPGGRLLSMSCSGGEAALVADMAEGRQITFPPFDPEDQVESGCNAQRIRRHRQPARLPHLHLESGRQADPDLLCSTDAEDLTPHFSFSTFRPFRPWIPRPGS